MGVRGGIARHAGWLVGALPVLVVVAMGWHWRWMSDDGFIHLRVVQQIAHGNGPVFNVGERVEASTSPLWVWLLALVHPITSVALPWKAVAMGIGFSAVGLVAAQAAATRLARAAGHTSLVLPVGAAVVAALPPFWEYATSGLETGLAFAWIGLSCWWCNDRATGELGAGTVVQQPVLHRVREVAGAALVGLGWLIRPDLAIYVLAFGAVLLATVWPLGWRRRAGLVAAMAALPLAYQVFRMGYYAMAVPNTALAKEAGTSQWGRGWRYLVDFVDPYWLWVPLALLLVVLAWQVVADVADARGTESRRARLRLAARLAPAVAAAVHGLYVVRLGGDFMHARLLLPTVFALVAPIGLPLAALPWSIEGLRRRRGEVVAIGIGALVVGWAVVCAGWLRPGLSIPAALGAEPLPISDDGSIEEERELFVELTGMRHPVRQDLLTTTVDPSAQWHEPGVATVVDVDRILDLRPIRLPLRRDLDVHTATPASAVGVIAYRLGPDVYVVDLQGLAHPVGSHLDHWVPFYKAGHQKPVPLPWLVVGVSDVREARSAEGDIVATRGELAAARASVRCGQLGEYLRGIREPLTPGRFLGNLVDSIPNTLLRAPSDPVEARRDLCRR